MGSDLHYWHYARYGDGDRDPCGAVRQVPVEVQPHPAGGWRARLPGGTWGARCRAVTTSVLLEAGEAFPKSCPIPAPPRLILRNSRPTNWRHNAQP